MKEPNRTPVGGLTLCIDEVNLKIFGLLITDNFHLMIERFVAVLCGKMIELEKTYS